jgi:prepilin-type N-terminal cleavage/methylation domain-containing protein
MSHADSERGFSLIEAAIVLAVSGILVGGLVKFFRDSHQSVESQDSISERNQTLYYIMNRLGDPIMAAGTNLPEEGWNVISMVNRGDTILKLGVNRGGGTQTMDSSVLGTRNFPVDEAIDFQGSDKVLILYQNQNKPPELLTIDAGYNANGFSKGIKNNVGLPDTLRFTATKDYSYGDILFSYSENSYLVRLGTLYIDSVVLAENVDSVKVYFYDEVGVETSNWSRMRSAQLNVSVRTATPISGLGSDKYRHRAQTSDFRLRNRN